MQRNEQLDVLNLIQTVYLKLSWLHRNLLRLLLGFCGLRPIYKLLSCCSPSTAKEISCSETGKTFSHISCDVWDHVNWDWIFCCLHWLDARIIYKCSSGVPTIFRGARSEYSTIAEGGKCRVAIACTVENRGKDSSQSLAFKRPNTSFAVNTPCTTKSPCLHKRMTRWDLTLKSAYISIYMSE